MCKYETTSEITKKSKTTDDNKLVPNVSEGEESRIIFFL